MAERKSPLWEPVTDHVLDSIFNWPGGHVLTLIGINGCIALHASYFDKNCTTIKITDEPRHWSGSNLEKGIVFLIVPGLHKCVGPKSLLSYVAYNNSSFNDKDLLRLEEEMSLRKDLPQ